MPADILQKILIYIVPMLLAITLHEAAHAYAAKRLGDATAYMLGRVTLNPIKHIDPIWTIAVPIFTLLFTPFVFGGAKPVPVNYYNLRKPKRDMALVAAAGPLANLIMMIGWALFLRAAMSLDDSSVSDYFTRVGEAGILVNAGLMIFNLFPLLPLDGGRIVVGLLPDSLSIPFSRIEPYGMFIIIALLWTGVINAFVLPLLFISAKFAFLIAGIG
jgi:Zn-dependent protease